jgi:fluoroquinolone resistance protein
MHKLACSVLRWRKLPGVASGDTNKRQQKMKQIYIEEKTFEKQDFQDNPLTKGEYEYCRFINCDFLNVDLSDCKFTDCEFLGCNLSMAKLTETAFRDIRFIDCKMLGLYFDSCSEFGLLFSFENCILNNSTFYKTKIKKTTFKNTQLQEVDFTDCDLTNSLFDNCDLTRATFDNTIIERADFRTSYNYSIDPETNRIKKAKFSIHGISGLLYKHEIIIDNTK